MSGSIILTPERRHQCAPGWSDAGACPDGGRYVNPPDARQYPEGTVWQCDCGTAWVSRGPIAWNAPGIVGFTRERWLERRRRLRRAVAGE